MTLSPKEKESSYGTVEQDGAIDFAHLHPESLAVDIGGGIGPATRGGLSHYAVS